MDISRIARLCFVLHPCWFVVSPLTASMTETGFFFWWLRLDDARLGIDDYGMRIGDTVKLQQDC